MNSISKDKDAFQIRFTDKGTARFAKIIRYLRNVNSNEFHMEINVSKLTFRSVNATQTAVAICEMPFYMNSGNEYESSFEASKMRYVTCKDFLSDVLVKKTPSKLASN